LKEETIVQYRVRHRGDRGLVKKVSSVVGGGRVSLFSSATVTAMNTSASNPLYFDPNSPNALYSSASNASIPFSSSNASLGTMVGGVSSSSSLSMPAQQQQAMNMDPNSPAKFNENVRMAVQFLQVIQKLANSAIDGMYVKFIAWCEF
jgi:hypothetical protein